MNMEYMWVKTVMPEMSAFQLLKSMLLSAGITTLPEVVFAYYLLYFGYDSYINKKIPPIINFLLTTSVFIVCVALVRMAGFYILNNWAYDKRLAEKELWNIVTIWRSIIYFGFSSGLALSLHLFRRQLTAANREKLLVEEKLSVELKLLRNQLQPHFLFNTLNNIYSLTRKKSDLAPDAVLKLSDLLDFMLYKSETDTISLANEINFLENYIALEKIRYSNRLSINFIKNIDDFATPITPLILLPLVENAFKHGASESQNEIYINIEITQKGEEIFFAIENSCDVIGQPIYSGHIGLRNVSRRLELLYKNHKIEITPKSDSFKVNLYLNLQSYGKA